MEQRVVKGAALYAPCQQFWVRWKRKHSLVVYSISKLLINEVPAIDFTAFRVGLVYTHPKSWKAFSTKQIYDIYS